MDFDQLRVNEELRNRLIGLRDNFKGVSSIDRLLGDASTRVFFRLFLESGGTAVAMCYPLESYTDIPAFVDIQNYLTRLDLPVPSILERFDDFGILVLEDLGENLLENAVQDIGLMRRHQMYTSAVDLISRMIESTHSSSLSCHAHELAFDFEKLSFEMDFFVEHFIHGFLKADLDHETRKSLRESLYALCDTLAREPRFFVHRDYHARNLMVRDQALYMIDFQDARMGPLQYDLVSLLRDSYVTIESSIRETLIDRFYVATKRLSKQSAERFRLVFNLMALQRNLKALGTFGYQTTVIGSNRYRSSINRTISYIEENLVNNPNLIKNADMILDLLSLASLTTLADLPSTD